MSFLQKAHLHGNKSVPFWGGKKNLNSSLKLFMLKFISPCLMQPFLLSFPCSQRTDLGTAVQSPHCIGLVPSTCALEPVRLYDSSLHFSLKYTQTRYALTYTLSRVVTFLEGGAQVITSFRRMRESFSERNSISLPQLPPIFKWRRAQWRIAQRTLARLFERHKKPAELTNIPF